MVEDKLTTPANPLSGVIVIVEVPEEPERIVTPVGPALIAKSWTV